MDLNEEFYTAAGTSRMHTLPKFNPDIVEEGDTLFVKTDFIVNNIFQDLFLNKIKNKFNLISGISSYHIGRDGGDNYKEIIRNSYLNKWVCTNPPLEEHGKIIPIPIGFEEPDRPGGNQIFLQNMHNTRTDFKEKKDLIFLPYHNTDTNKARAETIKYISSLPFVHAQKERQSFNSYLNSIDQFKFVISLEGSGPDTHRNYETLLMGSIPINLNNTVKNIFNFHSVDSLFLDSWKELDLNMFDNFMKKNYNIKNNDRFLDLDYHTALIRSLL
jgi:hypothetical protein